MADKNIKTFPNGAAALTQYQLVKGPFTAVVEGAASTDDAIGIVQNGYAANATEVAVMLNGETRGIAHDGDINKGDLLEAAAAGRLDTHSGTSTKPIVARALEDSSAQDDEILIDLFSQTGAGPAA